MPEDKKEPIKTDEKGDKGEEKSDEKVITVRHEFITEKKPDKAEPVVKPEDDETGDNPEKPEKKDEPIKPTKNPTEDAEDKDDIKESRIRELESQLQEKDAVIATAALAEFEKEKNALLDQVTDETKKKGIEEWIGDDPDKLEQVKFWTGLMTKSIEEGGGTVEKTGEKKGEKKDGKPTEGGGSDENPEDIEEVPPKGNLGGLPKVSGINVSQKRIMDEIYAILGDPTKTPSEKAEAEKRINRLMASMLKGRKEANKQGKGDFARIYLSPCPECGYMMQGTSESDIETCRACGWKLNVKKETLAR